MKEARIVFMLRIQKSEIALSQKKKIMRVTKLKMIEAILNRVCRKNL
ncbi:hypothetical protein wTpre_239 [Wolbachia endosymbiont of Trichogramma pretiosum]|nr:hypothetical protein wTpre_239 [Wolbachia endosymbiont of Trichogramma pretiosum]